MNSYEQLNEKFNALAASFDEVSKHISNYKTGLADVIENVQKVKNLPMHESIKSDLPIVKVFTEIQKDFAEKCSLWSDKIIQNNINMEFRNKFTDSMLVYVYGKVKSGKSSLGNFIAHGRHNPSEVEIKRSPDIKYDIEVEALKEGELTAKEQEKLTLQRESTQKKSKFLVDFFEATSCIQYFTRPGLTWIDSPGIHSTTPSNGELAKKYLGSADLVVFTTTFRSACHDTDRNEILEIFKSGKPIVLAVTRSDDKDYDIDDNGNEITSLIMKSNSDREKVKEWCIKSIQDTLGGEAWDNYHKQFNNRVITISCKYAEENFNDNGLAESGITEFCQTLMDIARSEGVKIKKNTPLQAIISNMEMIKNDSEELLSSLNNAASELNRLTESMKYNCKNIIYECNKEIYSQILPLVNTHYGNDEAFKNAVVSLLETIAANAQQKLAQSILDNTAAVVQNLNIDEHKLFVTEFADYTQTVTYGSTKRGWGAFLGGLVGGALGIIGGPAGIAAGAAFGAAVGGKIGKSFSSNESTTIKTGDNRNKVARDTAKAIEPLIEKLLQDTCDNVKNQGITPLQTWLTKIKTELNSCNMYIAEQETIINKELAR